MDLFSFFSRITAALFPFLTPLLFSIPPSINTIICGPSTQSCTLYVATKIKIGTIFYFVLGCTAIAVGAPEQKKMEQKRWPILKAKEKSGRAKKAGATGTEG